MTIRLHGFFQSSTSYRARIALALKDVTYEYVAVNLRAAEHREAEFLALNATPALPMLEVAEEGTVMRLGQSLAIIDWLDSRFPSPRLISDAQPLRARVLEFATLIACDIHPVNNLRVLKYLSRLGVPEAARDEWYAHWIAEGLAGAEQLLDWYGAEGGWCFGAAPTLADVCLVPQMANADRMNCDLAPYPRLRAAREHAAIHPAFMAAAPQNQPDYLG
ncbi:maleylacetoacetate isomerase [Polymorphobacter sp.]|uniref:maleylacetoacetate isomerase n=1 Tax=Polymorphobacter sp. TaxID=1909290 RepID=UPI003F71A197